ncbi:ATP-grasp domain-containing protein [Bacillus cereus]|nr:ATP-grasp domain-containing protein [Bacillus cereus]
MNKHIVFIEVSMSGAGEKAIDYAIERGYQITVVCKDIKRYNTTLPNDVNYLECDTNNLDHLLEEVRKLNNKYTINGVTTTHDYYVPQASFVAEDLGLPSISYQAAKDVRNKYKMRLNIKKHCPYLNPPFQLAYSIEEAVNFARINGYPFIAKPQDANDSWNVVKINSEDELIEYMKIAESWGLNTSGQSLASGVLLEGYIDGDEFSVETIQFKGESIQLIGVTGKALMGTERGYFVEAGAYFPVNNAYTNLLYKEVALALKMLNIDCGVIHTECRIQNGQVKIIEINPRLMGDMAGSHMIQLALDSNPCEMVVETALGNSLTWKVNSNKGAAIFGISIPETGEFGGISNLESLKKLPGVSDLKVMAKIGDKVNYPPLSNGDFVARLVTEAKTPEMALQYAKNAAKQADVLLLNRR